MITRYLVDARRRGRASGRPPEPRDVLRGGARAGRAGGGRRMAAGTHGRGLVREQREESSDANEEKEPRAGRPGSSSLACSSSWSRSRPAAATTTTTTRRATSRGARPRSARARARSTSIAWAGYVEDGSTDPKVDWVTRLREGDRLPGQRQGRQHLRRDGAADADRRSTTASRRPATRPSRLIEGGDVDPVNTDLIPNYADVFDALKDQPYNSVDGQMYGIPHGRGANLLMYDTDEVKPAPTSWDVVFDEAGEYSGKVTAYDNPIYIADAALYLREHQPDLGITDPYELDEEQFDAAIDLLKEQNENIGEYWSDYTKEIQAFANGDIVGRHDLAGDQPTCSRPTARTVEAVLPEEGATGWSDTWMISSEAEHPELHVHVDGPHHQPGGATPRSPSGSARRPPTRRRATLDRPIQKHCEIYHARRTRSSSTRSSTGRPRSPTAATTAARSARPTTSGSRAGPRSRADRASERVEARRSTPQRRGGRRAAGSPTSSTAARGCRRGRCWPARSAGWSSATSARSRSC